MIRDIKYLEDKDIVQLRTTGTFVLEAEVEILKQVALKLKEHHCNKCIIDHRQTDVIARTIPAYQRPAVYEEIWGDRTTSGAVVLKDLNKDAQFLETVVRNRGWNMRIFDDYDAAVDWLVK